MDKNKRFIFDGLHIRDTLNEIPLIMAHNDEQRDEFLDGLNGLAEENNELKKKNEQLKKENYGLHKRLRDFEQFERYMKERTTK